MQKKWQWTIPPVNDTFFKITKNSVSLSDSVIRNSTLYYYNNDGEYVSNPGCDDTSYMYLANDYYGSEEYNNSKVVFFRYIATININNNINKFYIKYPDGDIDTLTVEAKKVSNTEGKEHRCYCTSPLTTLKFNGKDAIEDQSIKLANGQAVYLFEK